MCDLGQVTFLTYQMGWQYYLSDQSANRFSYLEQYMAYRKCYKYQLSLTLILDEYFQKSTVRILPAKWSTLITKSIEHFSAYNLLDAVDHFLLLRTLHLDSKDHLLVLLLFFWLLFLSLHGLFFSIPCHPNVNSLFFSCLFSPWVTTPMA